MKNIALLPMKGHSERIPNKNIKDFNGIPLFHIILKKLETLDIIDEIIINTDSKIIADSAVNFSKKVVIHNRIKELCGDFIPMNDIINYDINHSKGNVYIQTHSTNPLLKTQTLKNAINFFLQNNDKFDSIFSVTKHQARFYNKDLKAINHNPNELLRTQDLAPLYEENSCFYIFTKESFQNNSNKRIGIKPYIFELNKFESVDIDENDDFLLAELIHKNFPEYQ